MVITASAAMAPPSANDPVSPMNTDAGYELNHRNPTHAPISVAAKMAMSRCPVTTKVMPM